MPKRSFVAVAAVVMLTGCAGAPQSAQPSPTGAVTDNRQLLEAAKADCMKQKGFTYVAFVPPEKKKTADEVKRDNGDYQSMRDYRRKYGFGVFAELVYPKEFGNPAVKPDNPVINPNMKIQSDLSKPQFAAYRKALDACYVESVKKVLGKTLRSANDYFIQVNKAAKELTISRIDSDPKLVELASAMADCLKGKGYATGKTTPSAMSERGSAEFTAEEDRLGRAQRDDVPKVAPPPKGDDDIPMIYMPTMTPEEAKPYLAKEIKAALDDLECGKDFYAVITPRENEINRQANAEFGM
ncbi:hypothetical protein ACIBHX_22140 [Nonomuraea sp. NPDC050536]|uniref:hypothetical protein n=1 Tax=Nonomuraea sp. NPDC050536 TaxID=3364366 RepID=UPI0037C61D7C